MPRKPIRRGACRPASACAASSSRRWCAAGGALIGEGRHAEALACYRQGLEIDDLDEDFYQGVMACALALQRPAEGLAAYQRLKRMLSILIGALPSERSEALHRQLRG